MNRIRTKTEAYYVPFLVINTSTHGSNIFGDSNVIISTEKFFADVHGISDGWKKAMIDERDRIENYRIDIKMIPYFKRINNLYFNNYNAVPF